MLGKLRRSLVNHTPSSRGSTLLERSFIMCGSGLRSQLPLRVRCCYALFYVKNRYILFVSSVRRKLALYLPNLIDNVRCSFFLFFLWGCTLAAAVLLLFEPQQATKRRWSLFCCWYVAWHSLSALKIEFRGNFSDVFISVVVLLPKMASVRCFDNDLRFQDLQSLPVLLFSFYLFSGKPMDFVAWFVWLRTKPRLTCHRKVVVAKGFYFFLFSERSSLCDEMLRSWVVLKVVRDVGRADSCYL